MSAGHLLSRRRAVAALGGALWLGACGPDLPQARHSYATPPDANDVARLSGDPTLTRDEKARLRQAQQNALRQRLDFVVLVQSASAPFAGVGFVEGATMGYAITADGAGGFFPDGQARLPLEQIAPRIARAEPAGVRGRRLFGLSHNGTMMAWNPDNMSQQVILRPQNSTFGQVHLFDAEPLRGSDSVAAAVQGKRLELWSLVSGNRIASAEVPGGQPRVIGTGSAPGAVVYGTDLGDVRIWRGGGRADYLYRHDGPVLDITVDRVGGRILSAAKDGTVTIRERDGRVSTPVIFPHAARQVLADPGGRFALALPARGAPRLIDLQDGKNIALDVGRSGRADDPVFLPGGRGLLMRLGPDRLGHWPLVLRGNPREFRPRIDPGKGVMAFAAAAAQDVLLLGTGAGRVEYWSLSRRVYLGTALAAPVGIDRLAVDPSGRRVIASLANREVVSFDLDPAQAEPIRLDLPDEP